MIIRGHHSQWESETSYTRLLSAGKMTGISFKQTKQGFHKPSEMNNITSVTLGGSVRLCTTDAIDSGEQTKAVSQNRTTKKQEITLLYKHGLLSLTSHFCCFSQ